MNLLSAIADNSLGIANLVFSECNNINVRMLPVTNLISTLRVNNDQVSTMSELAPTCHFKLITFVFEKKKKVFIYD